MHGLETYPVVLVWTSLGTECQCLPMLATSAMVVSACPGRQFEHSCDHTESQGADLAKNPPLSDFNRNNDNNGVNNILSLLPEGSGGIQERNNPFASANTVPFFLPPTMLTPVSDVGNLLRLNM